MALTPKQEKYVQGLVAGLSQRQAYKSAYNTERMKDTTIDNKASKLFKEDEIRARYGELIDEHKEKALWTREESVSALKWLIEKSVKSIEEQDEGYVRQGTSNAIISAVKELNELELLYPLKAKQVDKIDNDITKDDTAEDKLGDYLKVLGEAIDDN